MLGKRSQGRPKHGDAQVGRSRIIDGFIDMVRSGSYDDISRKQIAQHVGITPALITYYFPKGQLLMTEAFSDVFVKWYEELDDILSADKEYRVRLSAAFRTIVSFYKKEYHVELLYSDLCRRGVLAESTVDLMKARLTRFIADETARSHNAALPTSEILSNVIWGACQQCARLDQSDAVYEIVGRVALPRPPAGARAVKRDAMVRDGAARPDDIARGMSRAEEDLRFSSSSSAPMTVAAFLAAHPS